MVTLKDIALHVGISVSATSMALRDHASIASETKKRVWEAKKKLGYKLKGKPTGNIAFILFDRTFEESNYARIFQTIGKLAIENEQQPSYLVFKHDAFLHGKLPPVLQKRGVDGIIASGVYTAELHRKLSKTGIPLVALGNYYLGEEPWAACEVDLEGGLRLAVRTLKELKHQKIGLLVSSPEQSEYGRRMRIAFAAAAARFSLDALIVSESGNAMDEGEALTLGAEAILKSPRRPSALIVEKANSHVYDVCESLELKIPEDISIMALGHTKERLRPHLVKIESNPAELARLSFEKLQRLIQNPLELLSREVLAMSKTEGGSIGPASQSLSTKFPQ